MDANFRSRMEALLREKGMTQRELAASQRSSISCNSSRYS